jgi:hypothetical protein
VATITTRSGKGSPLTNNEVDANFTNLNNDKVETSTLNESIDDRVNALLQAGLGVDFTYDDANGELTIDSNHVEVACTNNSGATIAKGTPVYQSGASGNNITIAPADADDANKMPAIGMTTDAIANGNEGTVVVLGVVSGVDTSTYSAGDTVYISTTAGSLSTSPPTGESGLIQNFGRVLKVNASSGSIAVMGAGRANATPNLNDGNVFIGNASNQAEARALVEADISDLGTYITSVTFSDIDGGAVLLSSETFADVDNQLMTAAAIDDRIESKGYITSYTVTQSDVTTHQAALSITESQISDLGSYLSNVSEDTTPQLGGNLDVNGYNIVSVTNGNITLDPNGSGVAVFTGNSTRGAGQFKLNCENNSHAITIKGPPHSAAASYTLTLPNDDGTADQVLKTDGSGNLSWVDQSAGSSYGDNDVDTHLNTSTASANEVLSWTGSDYDWVAQSGGSGGGASVTTADSAPASPSDGDLWYDTTTLRLYVYYDDGSSSQWVKANPSGSAGIALTSLSVTTNSVGTAALSYNNTTGVFSYTPPDLSSYLTGITGQSIANLSDVYDSIAPANNSVLQWDNVNSRWDAANGVTPNNVQSYIDTHINTSTAASNEILSWNGSDYEWVEQGIATVYSLTGTAIDPTNGGIQTKTISANTTFTETLASGESVVLMLEGAASYTITWPTITWVTSSGDSAPTLTAKDTLVLWKVSTTLYGAYVGSYA